MSEPEKVPIFYYESRDFEPVSQVYKVFQDVNQLFRERLYKNYKILIDITVLDERNENES